MTRKDLSTAAVGTRVYLDTGEEGEIVQAGRIVHIRWPDVTSIIDTDAKQWDSFVCFLEELL